VIDYQAVDNITNELRDQYAIQEESGYRYKNPKDLEDIFRVQAGKLAAQGVKTIYEIAPASWTVEKTGREVTNLINTRTGDVLLEARLQEGWEEDPTAFTFKQTRNADREVVNAPIELQKRGEGFDRWGFDTSVEGMAHYGVTFSSGVPVFTPYYKDTSSKIFGINVEDAVKTAIAIAAIYYGGSYLLGGETAAAAGAAEAGAATAGAGTGATAGTTLATSTAVPNSFQAALPNLGVSTAATTAASTAVPGTFNAALPGLLSSTAAGAPIYFAEAVPANELAYPAREVAANYTPAPKSFQEALPGLGVETAASAAPFTAAPGSFQAALPSLLNAGAGLTSLSLLDGLKTATDVLDVANTIDNLLNPPSNQTQARQQQQQPMSRPQSQFSLPAPRQTVAGLLPLAERYRRSLI
jgi:hypothetical protein